MKALTKQVNALLDRKAAAAFNARRSDPDLKWRAEKQYALQIIDASDELQKCSPRSVASALATVATMGLTLDPTRKQCYLIPRAMKKGQQPQCMATPSYMGLEYLARQTGEVANIYTDLVHENDEYSQGVDRNGPYVDFTAARKDRGEVTHGFCITYYSNGHRHVEVMERAELDQVEKAASAAQYGKTPPSWKFWQNEMRKKAVTRRASKHWPISSSRLQRAIEAMDSAEPVDVQNPSGLLMSERQAKSIADLASELGFDPDQAVKNICAAHGVNDLSDILSSEVPAIKRGLQNRAKARKAS